VLRVDFREEFEERERVTKREGKTFSEISIGNQQRKNMYSDNGS